MSKKIILLFACVLSMLVIGCASDITPTVQPTVTPILSVPTATPPNNDPTWERIQASKIWRIGTSGNYAPFSFYNDKNELDGFDVQLGKALAEQMGITAQYTDFAFEGLGGAMTNGQIDSAIAAISVTPERQQEFDFSNVYFSGEDGVLGNKDANVRINSLDDFARYRVGVQSGTVYQNYLEQSLVATGQMLPSNVFVYSDLNAAINDVILNRIDVVWMDLKPAQDFAAQRGLQVVDRSLYPQFFAIAMPKNSPVLLQNVNTALNTLQSNGTLTRLAREYLHSEITPPVPLPTPQPMPTLAPNIPTPPPPLCVDGMAWVQDLSFDDNNMKNPPVLQPGQPFTKSWRVRNSGTCPWTPGYLLTYVRGNNPLAQMGGQPAPVTRQVNPGETFDFSVNLVAPAPPGIYQGFWQMRNASGALFGQTIWVGIQVPAPPTSPPPATQTPSPFIQFNANPTTVNQGQPVNFNWNVQNVREVYFYHDGQSWQNHGVPGVGSAVEYPAQSMNYYLRVVQTNNKVQTRQIFITVIPTPNAPEIREFYVQPAQILEGQCVAIYWDVRGQVNKITISKNNQPLWDGAPLSGKLDDCPKPAGQYNYTINASGPGGSNSRAQTVTVMASPPQEPVIKNFSAVPEWMYVGECTIVQWTTDTKAKNITLKRQGPDGEVILKQNALPMDGKQDCIAQYGDYTYILEATPPNGGAPESARTHVHVEPMQPAPK